ncbi:MAG: hypothetical protein EXR79_09670 [Myxococcales bacterium]|nr:hypothetical protein [Myxococcales bacterium]
MRLYDRVPARAIPPNVITAAAMGFGMASAFTSATSEHLPGELASERLQLAAWFVLLSVLLDKLDGSVARAIKGSSEFGVQFDSFADATAFGLAPAALVHAAAVTLAPDTWGASAPALLGLPASYVLGGLCLVYAAMTTVRLARFNVMTAAIGPALFLGLPSTVSGALIASAFLALGETGLARTQPTAFVWFPVWLVLNAALMVSNLPLPKFKLAKNHGWRTFQIVAGTASYVAVITRTGITMVFVLLIGFLIVGFGWLGPRLRHEAEAAAAGKSG